MQNIVVGRKADQLHILNTGWGPSVTGTPAAVYRVVYADGKVEKFVARYEIEIGEPGSLETPDNIPNLVWRGEQAAIATSRETRPCTWRPGTIRGRS
ncbi:MAG: hypothetical protein CM1200mP2_52890 [Planctomycetaceae bacterium]|nr:MAG: hypothetical protein CM1200mP2_52890 [Planctomycetaceae bacterium]